MRQYLTIKHICANCMIVELTASLKYQNTRQVPLNASENARGAVTQ